MFFKFFQKLKQLIDSDKMIWIIIGIGISLRLIRYLHNPSFWFDESDTAIDILSRPFSNLIEPSPDWSNKYPYGHLLLIKFASQVFGSSEYSLRLFPLLFGVLSVLLFYRVAKKYITPAAVPIALGLFAVSDPLIYQSSNLKPYSGDLSFALIMLLGADYLQSKRMNIFHITVTGVMGAIIVWFSHPSLFVLAGLGACLAVFSFRDKEWSKTRGLAISYSMWALSFFACYIFYIRNIIANFDLTIEELLIMERAFIPFPPGSLSDIRLIMDSFFKVFDFPVGLSLTGIAALAFLIGCITIFRTDRKKLFILLSPLFITLFASILHKYPFKGRLIIFLVPFILLFIAEGIAYIKEKISLNSAIPGLLLVGLLFVYPLSWAVYHVKHPFSQEEIRPVISYIKDNWQEGDIIYVHYYPQYAFEYYTKFHPDRFTFKEDDYIIGIAPRGWYRTWRKQHVSRYYSSDTAIVQSNTDVLKEYIKEMKRLKGRKRVWFLFSAITGRDGIQEEKFFLFQLDSNGKRLDSFGRTGVASVYLYDLNNNSISPWSAL